MPEEKHSLLVVDDEPNVLSSLRRLLRREGYKLHMATSGEEALELLTRERVDLVITDGRMPSMSGIELLKRVKALYPDTVRMILTGYTDVLELADAINEGQAYKFVLKPWNDEELRLSIRHALEYHHLVKENEQLVEQIKKQNEELKVLNVSLEHAVERKTRELQVHDRVLVLSQQVLDQLDISIVGVDALGTIVQANRHGIEHMLQNTGGVGGNMADCLPPEVQEAVKKTIATGACQMLPPESAGSVTCYPLDSDGETAGAVIISYVSENPFHRQFHLVLMGSEDQEATPCK